MFRAHVLETRALCLKLVNYWDKQILCSVTFFSEHLAAYEIMWKSPVGRGKPQMTVWCMCISCWIPKATRTLRICNTYCFSTPTMDARKPLNIRLYVHFLSCQRVNKILCSDLKTFWCSILSCQYIYIYIYIYIRAIQFLSYSILSVLIKLSTWSCLEIRMQDEFRVWELIIVPSRGLKSLNIWEQV